MTIKDDRPNNLSKCAIINGLVLVYNITHADLFTHSAQKGYENQFKF